MALKFLNIFLFLTLCSVSLHATAMDEREEGSVHHPVTAQGVLQMPIILWNVLDQSDHATMACVLRASKALQTSVTNYIQTNGPKHHEALVAALLKSHPNRYNRLRRHGLSMAFPTPPEVLEARSVVNWFLEKRLRGHFGAGLSPDSTEGQSCQRFVLSMAQWHVPTGVVAVIDGHNREIFGFRRNPQEARRYARSLGDHPSTDGVLCRRVDMLLEDMDSLNDEPLRAQGVRYKARSLNQRLVRRSVPGAIKNKLGGLLGENPLYLPSYFKAMEFLETLDLAGDPTGLELSITGQSEGIHGLDQDVKEARQRVRTLIANDHPLGIHLGLVAFSLGEFGFQESDEKLFDFINEKADAGHMEAIQWRLYGLAFGAHQFRRSRAALEQVLKDLSASKPLLVHYLHMADWMWGIFGTTPQPDRARKYMATHNVPFYF